MPISNLTQKQGLQRPSLDYYAFRHLRFEQFQAIQVIYALFYQLIALPSCSDDINVVRHKTHFWLTDIHAAYQATPSHPITGDLQNLLKNTPLALEDWVGVLTAVEMDCDGLLLADEQEIQTYADKLYGSLYRMIALVLTSAHLPLQNLAYARTILMFIQAPHRKGVRVNLPDNAQTQVYTLFQTAGNQLSGPLALLARLHKHQAKKPMVHLGPLQLLGLSIRERLYPTN